MNAKKTTPAQASEARELFVAQNLYVGVKSKTKKAKLMKLMLYFLENQNRFIPKRTLANYLEVDIRTLYRYLKLVSELTNVELTQQFGRYGYVQKAA
jgi:hypothetical protein